jgi:hypothetical protein
MMWDTLERSAVGCSSFLVIFFIFFFAFAQAFCIVFHSRIPQFRTIGQTNFALMEALLGDFDFDQMQNADSIMGPVLFILFICLAVFVVLNTLIAIISDAYCDAQEHAGSLPPVDLVAEIIEYILNGLKTYVPGGKAILACMDWGKRCCRKSVMPDHLQDAHERRESVRLGQAHQGDRDKPEGLSNEELSEQMFTLQMSVRSMLTALEDDLASNKTASLETEVKQLKEVVTGMAQAQSGVAHRHGTVMANINERIANVEATPIVEHHRRLQATSPRAKQRSGVDGGLNS